MLIYWHSPTLLVVVSLVAAIHSQQAPADVRQNELFQASGQQQPAANQQQQQQQANVAQMPPAISSNKVAASSPGAGLPWPRMAKRSWNKMQGVWGKRRAPQDEADASAEYDDGDETEVNDQAKRAWSSLTQQGWGKRSWNQMYGAWGKRGGNNWNKMQGVWGKRSVDQDTDADDATDEYLMAAKRSNWNKMQGVWGKRSSSANDAFGAQDDDGDDEPAANEKRAWNQLHGAWGKRSPVAARHPDDQRSNGGDDDDGDDDPLDSWTAEKRGLSPLAAGYKRNWSNLRGSWGKREMPLAIIAGKGNEWSRKRESGWNNLKGLWG